MAKGARQMRAVVVELQARRAVVLTKDGRFLKVVRKNHRLGEETWVTVPQEAFVPALRWATAAAALALVVAVMGRALPGAYAATVAYVSVQIDPGVTLGVASNGTVTSARAQDQDAAVVLSHLSLIGDSLPKAVTAIVDSSLAAGLVKSGHWVAYVVTVYPAKNQPLGLTLRKEVAQAEASGQRALAAAHVTDTHEVLAVSAKIAAEAQARGVPVGTYVVYLQLKTVSAKPLPLTALKGQGLSQSIVKSGDQAAFEQEVEGSGSGQTGPPGQAKGQKKKQGQLPEGIENLLPSLLPGSGSSGGSDSPGQGDGPGKSQRGSGDQGAKSQGKSDGQGGSSDHSGGSVTTPQLPGTDGTSLLPSSSGTDSTSPGTDSTSGGSSTTQQSSSNNDSGGS